MTVTLEGNVTRLTYAGFGLGVGALTTGTVEIVAMHASGVRPSYVGLKSMTSEDYPLLITLSGGAVPAGTTGVLASAALSPAGSYHHVIWRVDITAGPKQGTVEVVEYDIWIGPDGGTCDITDPANRVAALAAPALSGWPLTGPVPVYASEGAP